MLMLDKNKMVHWQPNVYLSPNTAAPFAQLRGNGCGCANCNGLSAYPQYDGYYGPPISGLSGLGLVPINGSADGSTDFVAMAAQFDPEPISKAALQTIATIENFFGVGAGRREANQIVPVQNQVHYNVLKPIAEAVNAPYKAQLTQGQLGTMLDALLNVKQRWLDFLHNTQWSDGRAAVQAENDLAFLFDDQERKLRELLVNAPYFGGPGDIPLVGPVTIPGQPGRGTAPISITGIGSSFGQTLSTYAPYLLFGVALFALPKIGKYR